MGWIFREKLRLSGRPPDRVPSTVDLAEIRTAGERFAAAMEGGLRILSVNAIDEVRMARRREAPRALVIFEALDDALAFSRHSLEVRNAGDLVGLLRTQAPAIRRRSRSRFRLTQHDGIALVDELVEAAVKYAGSTIGGLLAKLHNDPAGVVSISSDQHPTVKAWLIDGRIRCSFELNPQLRWNSERLVIRLPLLAVLQGSLKGKSLAVVADHPMLPRRVRIAVCHPVGNENELTLRLSARIVRRDELVV